MKASLRGIMWVAVCIAGTAFPLTGFAQGQATPPPPMAEDNLQPAEFTAILKEAWTFLKWETDSLNNTVGAKREFETTSEFEKRTVDARQQYLSKVTKYIKDKKIETRVLGVLLKASLKSYDADNQVYTVTCPTIVEAPYNIPTIVTEIPSNAYIGLADSIKLAYRTSSVYLKLDPHFRWHVNREVAQAALTDAVNIYFKVRFKVNMMQSGAGKTARFAIIPQRILLVNQRANTVYWEQALR